MKTTGCCNWKLLPFKWWLRNGAVAHTIETNLRWMCSLAPRSKRLEYLLFFKLVKLPNKMVYVYELKLLQKRKLSQLQLCYIFSMNRTWHGEKKILNFTNSNSNHFDTTCIWSYQIVSSPQWHLCIVNGIQLVEDFIACRHSGALDFADNSHGFSCKKKNISVYIRVIQKNKSCYFSSGQPHILFLYVKE